MFLHSELVEEIKKVGILRTYNAGETIFLLNEPATGMYLILTGQAKVIKRLDDGTNKEVASVRSGETMGEVSLLLGTPHTATVVAKEALDTILLTRNRLNELKREQTPLALRLYEMLAMTLARHLYERPW